MPAILVVLKPVVLGPTHASRLYRTGGMLLYRPDKVCRIILACGVLHNVAHRHGIPLEQHASRRGQMDGLQHWGGTLATPETLD
ncbi:hypothetical protein DPEC_G00251660 [Dallia pectoralis]|uniref:Uncharacterized protein n=1 Tax=Dallia pectoralis TaxID=75939 RepID=A0ACC2FTH6_DALPE|nr:hypothetical protein DPEC_G00251660 [Dallia pectoralis]